MADIGTFLYSAPKLAAAWGCSTRHVYGLCARGELGHLRIGGLIRIREADREAYEAQQWRAPNPKSQITSLSGPAIVSVSVGAKAGRSSAFQRGRQSSAKQLADSRNSSPDEKPGASPEKAIVVASWDGSAPVTERANLIRNRQRPGVSVLAGKVCDG